MPVIKSAKKKLRQDIKRQKQNKKLKDLLSQSLRKVKKSFSEGKFKQAVSLIDKAVKKNILHKNKAARIKSSLSNLSAKPQKKKEK